MKGMNKDSLKRCPRCGKSYTSEEICIICKNELLLQYNHKIDWKTAYQIEKEVDAGKKMHLNF